MGMSMGYMSRLMIFLALLALLLSACGGSASVETASPPAADNSIPASAADRLPTPTPLPAVIVPDVRTINLSQIPDYYASIPPDGIPPIYAPRFVNAQDAQLQPDELVLGIAIEGQAKAYPVTVLRFREMVNDELAGLPILATW